MAITQREILTISASEYARMVGRSLRDYEPIGVHVDKAIIPENMDVGESPIDFFISRVPDGTEVVVAYIQRLDFTHRVHRVGCYLDSHGTALVPRKREK